MLPILNYRDHPPAPRALTLDESDGTVRVIFPVMPAWVYLLGIGSQASFGAFQIVMTIAIVWKLWQMFTGWGAVSPENKLALRTLMVSVGAPAIATASLYLAAAAYQWWIYRRWGRVPRTISTDGQFLVQSNLGMFRMRERKWAASEITGIELRAIKRNLNWKRTAANLIIHRRDARRLSFRLSSSDPTLPRQIAERFAAALHCPPVFDASSATAIAGEAFTH